MKDTVFMRIFHKKKCPAKRLSVLCLLLFLSACGRVSPPDSSHDSVPSAVYSDRPGKSRVTDSASETASANETPSPTELPTPTPTELPTPTDPPKPVRPTVTSITMPSAPGDITYENSSGTVFMDASDTENGYIMIRYTGSADRVQIQIENPDGTVNPYPLRLGSLEAFPFTGGSGIYQINVYEHVIDDQYAVGLSETLSVSLIDEYRPFLYPNQYCDYTEDSQAVRLAQELSNQSQDDLSFVEQVFHDVITTVSYDNDFAANTPANYIPDPDRTLATRTGICFDYASLMTAMLRSQNIPTKLVVGYSGSAYHAWITVHITGIGWVEHMIQFDGSNWVLMDPTLAANNDPEAAKNYIGDGSHYSVSYYY